MPIYCYKMADGEEIELSMTISQMLKMQRGGDSIKLDDGRVAKRDMYKEMGGIPQGSCAKWPILSDAVGVGHDQVDEARAESVRLGVPTDFTADGRAILRTPRHRKEYCEALGFFDRDGGYSDPQRRT